MLLHSWAKIKPYPSWLWKENTWKASLSRLLLYLFWQAQPQAKQLLSKASWPSCEALLGLYVREGGRKKGRDRMRQRSSGWHKEYWMKWYSPGRSRATELQGLFHWFCFHKRSCIVFAFKGDISLLICTDTPQYHSFPSLTSCKCTSE